MHTFRAYAKINLGLLVLEKRPDGYHSIETVFHRVNLFDTVTLSPSRELVVESSPPAAPANEGNICFTAARLLQQHLGLSTGVKISIEKNIPVGAGLGGGSSDATAVLLHLPRFWGRTISTESLEEMALRLGSDVPYFLKPGSALARGRGEILDYFYLDVPYAVLLCYPGIQVSTAWAYQHVQPRMRSYDLKALVKYGMRDRQLLAGLTNDFEASVFASHPVVAQVKKAMLDSGAFYSSLSGSGSTVFGLFDDVQKARDTAAALTARGLAAYLTGPHFSPEAREP